MIGVRTTDGREGLDLSSADTNNEKPDIGNTRRDTSEDRLDMPLDIFLLLKGFHLGPFYQHIYRVVFLTAKYKKVNLG